MALTRVECAVRSDTADVFVGCDLVEKIRQHWSIANTAGRHLDGPYLKCFFIDPICILRQRRRLGPPCLRAFHSPSPSASIPVLSISRCSGLDEPRYGILTGNVFCRRHKVLKSGTDHSRPVRAKRLSTKPVVCRKGKPNSTLIVRHAWIAVSMLTASFT